MVNIEKRNIAISFILSLVTFGFYGLYWQVKMTDEAHEFLGRKTCASGGWALCFTFLTIGIYFLYWVYKVAKELNLAKTERGYEVDSYMPLLCLVLTLFGFGFVSMMLIQSGLNTLVEIDYGDDDENDYEFGKEA